jgi:hypothetical protein
MPENELNSTIALLESRLAEYERKASELRSAINLLYDEAGQPQKYADVASGGSAAGGGGGSVLIQIKRDTFYGKKQMTAVREYLEMRRGQGNGPATPREIFDALKAGGYAFGTKTDHIALVTLRALLRKATTVFHKLPGTGTYGLSAWYPDAKPSKADNDSEYNSGSRKRAKGARGKSKPKPLKRLALVPPGGKGKEQGAAAEPTAAPEGK